MSNRKPVSEITDRAKRYRANEDFAGDRSRCHYCGNPAAKILIDHVDGDESHGEPENLAACCRPCNHLKDAVLKAVGLGRPTRQYNPEKKKKAAAGGGASSMGQYLSAVRIMRGEVPGDVSAAVRTVRATSAAARSRFARDIWQIRRERYGATGRQDSLPF